MKELRQIIELFRHQLREIEQSLVIIEKQLKIIEKVISDSYQNGYFERVERNDRR